jgi:nitrogen-specific signal transduction histidine kinase/CheY-like chemotaxis protein
VPIPRLPGEQPAGVVLTLRDLTASRREAEQLQYLQKMESVGVIAAGIAHDFNNLLTPILGFIDLALSDIPAESPARPPLVESQKAARRAADLTMQLLAYSGKGRLVPQPTNLSALVEELMVLLQASVSKKATLRFQLASGLPEIRADATQLRQVLLNLVINASEALEDRPGEIRVKTGEDFLDHPSDLPGAPANASPGRFVFLEVSDNGVGMDTETLARVFDPFFTTKFLGRGLGLAAAQGTVQGHGGVILVRSAPGAGTTFCVWLPVDSVRPAAPTAPAPAPHVAARVPRGTILLAEDESAVRLVVQRILEKDGWTVLAARDGEEAIEMFQKLAGPPMLVVLDLTMPRLSGQEALARIHQLNPDVPVLVMSGYSAEEVASGFAPGGVRGFLQKPFAPAELLGAVHAALAESVTK